MRRVVGSLLALAFVTLAQAEDRGRLPNGTAYRTDENGTQLVDYIAELEVTNETLEGQVRSLKTELADAKLRGAISAPVVERDLLGSAPSRQPVQPRLLEVKELTKCPSCVCPAAPACDSQIADQRAAWSAEKAKSDSVASERGAQVATLSEEMAALRSNNLALKTELQQVNSALLSRGNELSSAQRELQVTLTALKDSKDALAKLSKENGALKSDVTLVKNTPRVEVVQPKRASLSAARGLALDSVRGQLKTDLNQLTGMLRLREKRFADYAGRGGSLRLAPVPAVSARGLGLNEILERMKIAQGIYELSQLKRDITDINAKIQDDLALIERMMKTVS
jgi:hypothetical protein